MMRRWLRRAKLVSVTSILLAFSMVVSAARVGASGSASLNLSAPSNSVPKGGLLSISLSLSLQETTDSVQIFLNYDASKLQFLSINGTDSAFNSDSNSGGGNGVVEVSRYQINGNISGTVKVAVVNFRGLVDSGASTIAIGENTIIPTADGTSNQWNGNTAGATYTHTTAAVDLQNNTQEQQAKIAAITPVDEPVPVTADSSIANVKTFIVAIVVKDRSGRTIENAKVTLGGVTAQTDKQGVAGFTGVPAGKYTVHTDASSFDLDTDISVSDEADPLQIQQFEVIENDTSTKDKKTVLLILGVAALAVLAFVLSVIARRKRKANLNKDTEQL